MLTYYSRPGENLIASLTPTVTGTLAASSSIAFAVDSHPARRVVFLDTAIRLVWDLSAPIAVPYFTIHNHNLFGGTATIQAHTSSSWGAPDHSADITLAAADGDGPYPDLRIDLSAFSAKQFLSLVVAGNAAAVYFGQLWAWAQRREFLTSGGLDGVGQERPQGAPSIVHATGQDVEHVYQRGPRRDGVDTQVMTDTTGLAELHALAQAARWRSRPFPIVLNASVQRAEFVRLQQDAIVPRYHGGLITAPIALRSLSRGVAA